MTKKDVVTLFQSARVDVSLANKVYREYGRDTYTELKKDPYTTLYSIPGLTLDHADKISRYLRRTLEETVLGHIQWMVLRRPTPEATLKVKVQTTLGLNAQVMDTILQSLLRDGRIHRIEKYVLHPKEHDVLRSVASQVHERSSGMHFHDDMEDAFDGIECTPEQRKALDMVATHRLSVITGGPGCGKSWIVRQMVQAFPRSRVTAPTGRAARNAEGKTVHYFKTIQETQKNELHGVELIVVDEASMLSAYLFDIVLQMASPRAHVVLVGDKNQLPPIQTGHVLRDLLNSNTLPYVQLTQNHRSSAPIQTFCAEMLRGHLTTPPECVWFMECHTLDEMLNRLPRVYPDIILTPHNVTRVQMNRVLQLFTSGMRAKDNLLEVDIIDSHGPLEKHRRGTAKVSPTKITVSDGLSNEVEMTYAVASRTVQPLGIKAESGTVIRSHDKVIITKNTATLCNGDMGTYVGNQMVQTQEDTYEIPPIGDTDPGFALGYCITVHKAQGSEFHTVVIPVSNVSAWTRTLLYTAVTRAKERIIFLGTLHDVQCILRHHTDRQLPPFLQSMMQDRV